MAMGTAGCQLGRSSCSPTMAAPATVIEKRLRMAEASEGFLIVWTRME